MHTCMQHQIQQCGALRTYPWQCRVLTQTCIVGPYDLQRGGQPCRLIQGLVDADPHRTVTHHSRRPIRPQKVNFLFLIHHPHAFSSNGAIKTQCNNIYCFHIEILYMQ